MTVIVIVNLVAFFYYCINPSIRVTGGGVGPMMHTSSDQRYQHPFEFQPSSSVASEAEQVVNGSVSRTTHHASLDGINKAFLIMMSDSKTNCKEVSV